MKPWQWRGRGNAPTGAAYKHRTTAPHSSIVAMQSFRLFSSYARSKRAITEIPGAQHLEYQMNCLKIGKDTVIYQGEALSVLHSLPADSVDAVITDPPYSTGGMTLASKQQEPCKKYQNSGTKKTYPAMLGDTRDQRSYAFWATWWLSECWRIAREGSPLLVFTDWRQLPTLTDAIQAAGWLWRGVVVWQKPSARPAIGEFRREAEFVIYGSKGKPSLHSRRCFPGVFKCPVNAATKVHITGKPVALLQELMGVVVDGGTVLDPFLGGGTTAHAALLTGRKCIGVELSPEYAKLSAERLLEIA